MSSIGCLTSSLCSGSEAFIGCGYDYGPAFVSQQQDKIGLIYGLVDPRYGLIRYVGQTTGLFSKRPFDHVREATKSERNTKKLSWIRKLLSLKIEPLPTVIAQGILVPFVTYLQIDNKFVPFYDNDLLDNEEKKWITVVRNDCKEAGNDCVNVSPGGENQTMPFGQNNGMYGKCHTQESKEKIRLRALGRKSSDETKKKMSESAKISQNTPERKEQRKNQVPPFLGKHHTEEAKEKDRKAHLGKKASLETKALLSEMRKGERNSFFGKHHTNETKEKIAQKERETCAIRRKKDCLYISIIDFYRKNNFVSLNALKKAYPSVNEFRIDNFLCWIIKDLQLQKIRIHLGKPGQPEVGYGDEESAKRWFQCQQ